MRLPALISALCLLASPLMAQDTNPAAESLAKYFGQTCLKYSPNLTRIVELEDTFGLERIATGPLEMFELIYGLNVTNGGGITYQGMTAEGVVFEMHLTEFTQDGHPYYGCTLGSPDVSGAALEAAFKAQYGLPGHPVLTDELPNFHHRMWNFGDSEFPQYFILMNKPDPSEPSSIIAHFGRQS